jgi:hypothetical protein
MAARWALDIFDVSMTDVFSSVFIKASPFLFPRSQVALGNVSCSREISFRANPSRRDLVEIGNEIASAIAFPSATWERGMQENQWNGP